MLQGRVALGVWCSGGVLLCGIMFWGHSVAGACWGGMVLRALRSGSTLLLRQNVAGHNSAGAVYAQCLAELVLWGLGLRALTNHLEEGC